MSDIEDTFRRIAREVVREELARLAADDAPAKYLSTDAAAEFADVAVGTIRRWVREGKLPEHRAGRRVRVLRADLEKLLEGPRRARNDGNLSIEERAMKAIGLR